eukprot:gene14760-15665_t
MSPPHVDWKVIAIRNFKSDGADEETVKLGTIGTVTEEVGDNDKYIKFNGQDKQLLVRGKNTKRYIRWHEDHIGTVERWMPGGKFGFAQTDIGRLFVSKRDVLVDHVQHICPNAVVGFVEAEECEKGPKAIGVEVLYGSLDIEDVKVEPGPGRGRGRGTDRHDEWIIGEVITVRGSYGFIKNDTDSCDVFFHRSKWEADVEPEPGMLVKFKTERGKGGRLQASSVQLGGGYGRPAGGKDTTKDKAKKRFPKPIKEEYDEKPQTAGTDGKAPQVAAASGSGCTDAAAARAGLLYMLEGIGQSVM